MTDVEIKLTANLDSATKEVASFRKEYANLVRAVEKPLRQTNALKALEQELESTGQSVRKTQDRMKSLQAELVRTEFPTRKMMEAYRDTGSELERLLRTEARQSNELDRMRTELKGAGVDTARLTQEQRRLNEELSRGLDAGRKDLATIGLRQRAAAIAQVTREQRLSNIEAAKENLGVNRYRALEAELSRVKNQYQLLRNVGGLTNRELAVAQASVTHRVRETEAAMRDLAGVQQRIRSGNSGIGSLVGGIGAAYAAFNAVRTITQQADAYSLMTARLQLATDSQEEFNATQADLGKIALSSQSSISSMVTLYSRISRPLKDAGRSQEDILKVTEAVANSFRISGASAEEAENGVIQFAQALGAGALRGDEFNSVAEQAPRLMRALADSLGVPIGALKDMAADGVLTIDVVTDALVDQFEKVRTEASLLPDTVSGALTALSDAFTAAVGKADVQPLIDSIKELGATLSDPQVAQGLADIATGMSTLARWAVITASEFSRFAKQIAFSAAEANGYVDELTKLEKTLEEVRAAQTGSSFVGSNTVAQLLKFFDPEGLNKWAEELESQIKSMRAKISGVTDEVLADQEGAAAKLDEINSQAQAEQKAAFNKALSERRKYLADLKLLQSQQVKDAESALKKLVAVEKAAQSDIEKVRADRLKIEQRYQDALAGFGGDGDASYGAANALKVSARQALNRGDIETAQTQARAALKMIQDLAKAGENTYGFSGFINELQAIELAANDIEQSNAELKLKSIQEQMKALKDASEELNDMPVGVKTDEASIEAVRSQIQTLAEQLGKTEIVLPVRVQHPDGPIVSPLPDYAGDYILPNLQPPGFASGGGIRGPGTGTSDSILARLSNGEYVIQAAAVRHYGPEVLDMINKRRLPAFAQGGLISPTYAPSIPAMGPAPTSPVSSGDWGTLMVDLGGGVMPVAMPRSVAAELREVARKVGSARPTRR
ncbi:MAG: hypothetical protein CMK72_01020 [Pseudomonadaceae bacterium]|nr:hypothetical protein [Pseudomonadaceae bacterium]HCP54595.1 hypothetical protein [Pseudomonas sp.]